VQRVRKQLARVPGFRYRDQVSDVTIEAWGSTLEETLAQACLGMWALVVDLPTVPLTRDWTVSACGADLEELVVSFLNEQILLFDCEGLVAGGVEGLTLHEKGDEKGDMFEVRTIMKGCRSDELAAPPGRSIKAATFHGLTVSPRLIEVTLDV